MQNSLLFNARAIASLALAATLLFIIVQPATDRPVSAQATVDICDRTPQIELAILTNIEEDPNSRPACDAVTDTQLAAITSIDVSGDLGDRN